MKMIKINTQIKKWEHNSVLIETEMTGSETLFFYMYPFNTLDNSILKITASLYLTKSQTNISLEIESIIQFYTNKPLPDSHDLYEAYLKVREDWNYEIIQESKKKGFIFSLHFQSKRYIELEPQLKHILFADNQSSKSLYFNK